MDWSVVWSELKPRSVEMPERGRPLQSSPGSQARLGTIGAFSSSREVVAHERFRVLHARLARVGEEGDQPDLPAFVEEQDELPEFANLLQEELHPLIIQPFLRDLPQALTPRDTPLP